MRLGAIILLSVLVLFVWVQVFSFIGRERELQKTYSDYTVKLDKANLDLQKLKNEMQYYSNSANVEKTLRGEFNYKAPGEKLLIIVPKNQSSTAP